MPSRLVRDASAFFLRSLYRRVPRLMRALSGSTSSRRPAHGDIPWAARVLPVSRLGSYAERGTWRPPTTSRHEGESSRPPGGSPWVGLGGTRRGIERLVATPSACAGACCSRASCRSTSYGCRMPWLKVQVHTPERLGTTAEGHSIESFNPSVQKVSISRGRKGQNQSRSWGPGAGASSCPPGETGLGCRPAVSFFRREAKQFKDTGLPPCHKLGAVILERLS